MIFFVALLPTIVHLRALRILDYLLIGLAIAFILPQRRRAVHGVSYDPQTFNGRGSVGFDAAGHAMRGAFSGPAIMIRASIA
jgi:hypothetical protein